LEDIVEAVSLVFSNDGGKLIFVDNWVSTVDERSNLIGRIADLLGLGFSRGLRVRASFREGISNRDGRQMRSMEY
jgi:hypothetical protein